MLHVLPIVLSVSVLALWGVLRVRVSGRDGVETITIRMIGITVAGRRAVARNDWLRAGPMRWRVAGVPTAVVTAIEVGSVVVPWHTLELITINRLNLLFV